MAGGCNCNGACSCAFLSSGSVRVTGVGSATNPFRANMLASTDEDLAANRFVVLTDGGYVAPQALILPNGTTLLPNDDGSLSLPPPCILDYNGVPIEPEENGCIQLPTAGPPPDFACGLDTDEDGKLKVATTDTWPMLDLWGQPLDGDDTDGAGTICDSGGQVRSAPQGTAHDESMAQDLVLAGPTPVPDGGTWTSDVSNSVILNNPSPSRSMLVHVQAVAAVDAIAKPNSGTLVRLQSRLNGGAWGTRRELLWPEIFGDGEGDIRSKLPLHGTTRTVIGAGDSVVCELRVLVGNTEGGDPGIVLGITLGCTLTGWSR